MARDRFALQAAKIVKQTDFPLQYKHDYEDNWANVEVTKGDNPEINFSFLGNQKIKFDLETAKAIAETLPKVYPHDSNLQEILKHFRDPQESE